MMIKSRSTALGHAAAKTTYPLGSSLSSPHHPGPHGHAEPSFATHMQDHKYVKRQRQKQQERLFLVMMAILCFLALILVLILIRLLADVDASANETPSSSAALLTRTVEKQAHGASLSLSKSISRLRSNPLASLRRRGHDTDTSQHAALFRALDEVDLAIQHNLPSLTRVNPDLLVSLNAHPNPLLTQVQPKFNTPKFSMHGQFFRISRQLSSTKMQWQNEWEELQHKGPVVDYTQDDLYVYPPKLREPPLQGYPELRSLASIFEEWPQNQIDHPPSPIKERLQHFDYETELDVALLYRERKLPFKLTNVPELLQANLKWTDDYVAQQFDAMTSGIHSTAQGKCQESRHSYFAFFQPSGWNVETMGLPPTRNNDWTFATWAQHARYADAVSLPENKPHFYWQAGVPKEERELPPSAWSFVSRDLPSFSSPNATLVCHLPQEQKGIQCRFGERGVTAATHFDAGRNMVGMIMGAKRYILHPPRECSRLGIVTSRNSALFRHSLLNFGHFQKDPDLVLSDLERQWLERASTSMAVETVLKAGEILFVPSHWFHYIIGLQKNAQCNVRSGVDLDGDKEFGGAYHVSEEGCDPTKR